MRKWGAFPKGQRKGPFKGKLPWEGILWGKISGVEKGLDHLIKGIEGNDK